MRRAIWFKFTQNYDMKQTLLDTKDAILAESSPYDDFWGIKLHPNDPRARDPHQWQGTNWLGILLQEVRREIKLK